MTPERCAAIHAQAFAGTTRPWSAAEFQQLQDSPLCVFVFQPHSFACARIIGDEAELLTIATDPAHQTKGQGRHCLRALEAQCRARGAAKMFLEVAATNDRAIALYHSEDYQLMGTRPQYYRHHGVPVDAHLMQKSLD